MGERSWEREGMILRCRWRMLLRGSDVSGCVLKSGWQGLERDSSMKKAAGLGRGGILDRGLVNAIFPSTI